MKRTRNHVQDDRTWLEESLTTSSQSLTDCSTAPFWNVSGEGRMDKGTKAPSHSKTDITNTYTEAGPSVPHFEPASSCFTHSSVGRPGPLAVFPNELCPHPGMCLVVTSVMVRITPVDILPSGSPDLNFPKAETVVYPRGLTLQPTHSV